MKIYKDTNGIFWYGNISIPSGVLVVKVDEANDSISVSTYNEDLDAYIRPIYNIKITDLTDEDDIPYPTIEDFLFRLQGLFKGTVDASVTDTLMQSLNPSSNVGAISADNIDFDNSDFTNWTGNPEDLFTSPFGNSITNSTIDNPKQIILAFKRTISANQIGFGENNGGNFSNIKVSVLGSGGVTIGLFNDITHNEKKTSFNAVFGDTLFNSLLIEFYTSDPVSLSNLVIEKNSSAVITNGVNNSLPVGFDQVYPQDVDFLSTNVGNFEGAEVTDLLNYAGKPFVDSTTNNPKILKLDFIRPIQTNILGISTSTGDFSNVKILTGFGNVTGTETVIFDGSADNTKRNILLPQIPPITLSTLYFEFHTSDTVTLDSIGISKSIQTISRIQGQTASGNVTDFQASDLGNFKVALAEYQGDAFGRLRVSEPYTIFDSSLTSAAADTLFWSTLTNGTASGSYVQNTSSYNASVTTTGDYLVRQTKQRFKYQPGKSHEVLITGHLPTSTNVRKRCGLVDYDNKGLATITNAPQNGVFFENNGGVLSFNIVNNGVITETATQDQWNIDACDGTGGSGFTLDIDSTNIFFMDLEWLGVGAVRCGFVGADGAIIIAHQFRHASNGFTDVYMRTANLPVAYEITSIGGAGNIKQICSSVISEGGFNPKGIFRSIQNFAGVPVSSGDIELIKGIRLKEDEFEYSVDIDAISIIASTSGSARWVLTMNPVYSGTVTWTDLANSSIQHADGNNNLITLTPITNLGTVLASGYFSSDTDAVSQNIQSSLRIGKSLAGVRDELWLVIQPFSNETFYGSMNFRDTL